ncbi:hypothetical protein ABPG74_012507 [Tetrahymena malaccensis]
MQQQQQKQKVKEKVEEVYPNKNTLLNELRNENNKKYIQPECLTLTYKQIEKIEEQGIPDIFASIPYVHLSHNKISSLKGIQQFKNLQGLSVSHNLLADWTELLNIEHRSQIQFLRVRRNPLCKNPNYHSKLLEAFQNLEKLDDIKIDDKCHQIKYQTQHASQPYVMQLFKVLQIEFEKIEQKVQGLYPHLFDEHTPTSQKMNQIAQQNKNVQAASTNNILGELNRQKANSYSFINSKGVSTVTINQQNQSTNRSNLQQGLNTSITVTQAPPIQSYNQIKNQIEDVNYDFFDHLIAFLNNDPTLKLKKNAGSILLGGFLLRLWRMLGNFMLDPFYKNMMNIYDLQIDLFSRIMKKYRERHDHTIEQFLQQQCENNPKVDKQRLFSDLNYGYACFFQELFKISESPIIEEYEFVKDYLGIQERQLFQEQEYAKNINNQSKQQANLVPSQQANLQQQNINQNELDQHLQGVRPASQQYNPQTFASQMSQSIMEDYNKEQKKVNQSQNHFKNQSDLSPKNVSYFISKNEQFQQHQQSQANTNQINLEKAAYQAEIMILQNYFPLFLLNQDYMEIVFECVVEKLVALLHGYEIMMYGELEDDDEVFYKFQNVQKIFTIYNPQEEIYQSIQNIGKEQAINESRLNNQSRTKSERSINNLKRRSSANQSALSNRNNASQNQKSRLSNRQIDASSYVSQSKTNMSVRSMRQQTAESIGSKKTLQQQQKDRSQSVIDQLNNTLTRLNSKRGLSNSFIQNKSALNVNQNTTYQQLQQQQQQLNNYTSRSNGNIVPDLSPINQIGNNYNTNLLNTSQNQTALNMSREQMFQSLGLQGQQQQNYQTLQLTDYSPLNQQGNNSVSQNYQSTNIYDQANNSPFNIQQQNSLQQEQENAFSKSINQNQYSNSQRQINNRTLPSDETQQGQIGTSYFMQQNLSSKENNSADHSFNKQQSFSRLNQSKSAANFNQQNYLSHPGQHIGNYDSKEYSSYREYILKQQIPWSQMEQYKRSLQKTQYFVTILKNIISLHTIPQMKTFFLKLKLASDKKLLSLYNIMQRRMKMNAFKFWQRQVRKCTKNLLFNLMIKQKFFNILRKNAYLQKIQAEKHNSLQIKYKVFYGLVKILRNKRKIKKGLRKIRRLVLKKAILPIFQKLTLYYLTIPRNHTIQELNYNKIHQKSKQLFNQLSIHFKIEDDYKTLQHQKQEVVLKSLKSQIIDQQQQQQSLQIKDSFKIAQQQIDILNHQSRVQPEKGILSQRNSVVQNINKKIMKEDEDNKKTIKQKNQQQPSKTQIQKISQDRTFKQSQNQISK